MLAISYIKITTIFLKNKNLKALYTRMCILKEPSKKKLS